MYGLRVTGLRFFTVYGPWGRPDMAYFFFSQVCMHACSMAHRSCNAWCSLWLVWKQMMLRGDAIPVFVPNEVGATLQRDFTYASCAQPVCLCLLS